MSRSPAAEKADQKRNARPMAEILDENKSPAQQKMEAGFHIAPSIVELRTKAENDRLMDSIEF